MKIGIIGGGSVGLLMASLLAEDEHEITVYVRRENQKNALHTRGVVCYPGGAACRVHARLVSELKEEDLFLVCVKQYQLEGTLSYLMDMKTPVVFLQNGMGHIPQLDKLSTDQAIMVGTVEHGAMRINDYSVRHTGKGKVTVASWKDSSTLPMELNSDRFPVESAEEWFPLLAGKLIINAVINPLTAVFQVQNGMIIGNRHMMNLAKQLCEEASQVLQLDKEVQWQRIVKICEQTKENESSMLQDIKRGSETEIEGVSGYLLSQSRHNLPATAFIYQSIKALELLGQEEKDK